LKIDQDLCRQSDGISKSFKDDRDLLSYVAWQLGMAISQQIGEKFRLSYSAVSQRVRVIKEMLKDPENPDRLHIYTQLLLRLKSHSCISCLTPECGDHRAFFCI